MKLNVLWVLKPNDLNDLKKLRKPSDVIKLIFDFVSALKMENLGKLNSWKLLWVSVNTRRRFMFVKVTKRAIEQNAIDTSTALINGLADERIRWNNDRDEFHNIKLQLVGDVALACAFVAYCFWSI